MARNEHGSRKRCYDVITEFGLRHWFQRLLSLTVTHHTGRSHLRSCACPHQILYDLYVILNIWAKCHKKWTCRIFVISQTTERNKQTNTMYCSLCSLKHAWSQYTLLDVITLNELWGQHNTDTITITITNCLKEWSASVIPEFFTRPTRSICS